MAKLTLNDITGGYQTVDAYNVNNALIEAALENTLSLDGTTPNQMLADIDMNSNSLNNVDSLNTGSVLTTSLVLNGDVVTTSTTLTGGLTAAEVSFNGGTLQDALDDDYIRDDVDGVIAGDLSVVDLNASGNISGVDLTATGNIIVSGTVDGVDIATRDAVLTTHISTAVIKETAVTDHIRAGNTQIYAPDNHASSFNPLVATIATWESVGPTGSGAQNIWTAMDVMPANARVIILDIDIQLAQDSGVQATASVSATVEGVTPFSAIPLKICYIVAGDGNTDNPIQVAHNQAIVPLDSSQRFQFLYTYNNSSGEVFSLNYRGFITD